MPICQDPIPNLLSPELTEAFLRTVSAERWHTYQLASGYREDIAHKLYLWNAAVGQSFHFPLQTVEVALRNVIHRALVEIYGANWTRDQTCRDVLSNKQIANITEAERRYNHIYNAIATTPQIVASLSLGFWVSMLNREYDRPVWATQTVTGFPNLLPRQTIVDVSQTAKRVQRLRNRIFHQEPLIRNDLSGDYGAILKLIGWICSEMKEWTSKISSVPRVIRKRPR